MVVRCTLRAFRRKHGIGIRELAASAGLRKATLSAMERGLTKGVEYETLSVLVAWFRARGIPCEIGDLLVYEVPLPPEE